MQCGLRPTAFGYLLPTLYEESLLILKYTGLYQLAHVRTRHHVAVLVIFSLVHLASLL